jgi:hypothetical protein
MYVSINDVNKCLLHDANHLAGRAPSNGFYAINSHQDLSPCGVDAISDQIIYCSNWHLFIKFS